MWVLQTLPPPLPRSVCRLRSADSEYQEAYINLDYQGNMEKATDIYVNILSPTKTSFGSDDLQKAGTIDLTDCATGWTNHLGSRLKIDDLELIYE